MAFLKILCHSIFLKNFQEFQGILEILPEFIRILTKINNGHLEYDLDDESND